MGRYDNRSRLGKRSKELRHPPFPTLVPKGIKQRKADIKNWFDFWVEIS
jgi:hypothetical protein